MEDKGSRCLGTFPIYLEKERGNEREKRKREGAEQEKEKDH